jgi:hypothetical protein
MWPSDCRSPESTGKATMTDKELMKRLRDEDEGGWVAGLCNQAADRIEALTTALVKIREHNNTYGGSSYILRIIEEAQEKQP